MWPTPVVDEKSRISSSMFDFYLICENNARSHNMNILCNMLDVLECHSVLFIKGLTILFLFTKNLTIRQLCLFICLFEVFVPFEIFFTYMETSS